MERDRHEDRREPRDQGDHDDHVDLLGVLEGTLSTAGSADAVAHVRGCAECTDRLLALAVALGRVRDARRYPEIGRAHV